MYILFCELSKHIALKLHTDIIYFIYISIVTDIETFLLEGGEKLT